MYIWFFEFSQAETRFFLSFPLSGLAVVVIFFFLRTRCFWNHHQDWCICFQSLSISSEQKNPAFRPTTYPLIWQHWLLDSLKNRSPRDASVFRCATNKSRTCRFQASSISALRFFAQVRSATPKQPRWPCCMNWLVWKPRHFQDWESHLHFPAASCCYLDSLSIWDNVVAWASIDTTLQNQNREESNSWCVCLAPKWIIWSILAEEIIKIPHEMDDGVDDGGDEVDFAAASKPP